MRKVDWKTWLIPLISPLALAACSGPEPEKAKAEVVPVSVHDEMLSVIIPQAQVIWDVSNASLDDAGLADPKKIGDADWKNLKAASSQMLASLDRMATADRIIAAKQGDAIMDQDTPGGTKPQEVQSRIDANKQGFHDHAQQLKNFIQVVNTAADKKDFKTFYDKSQELDGACEGCHKAYWLKPAT